MISARGTFLALLLGELALFALIGLAGERALALLLVFSQIVFLVLCLPMNWSETIGGNTSPKKKIAIGMFLGAILGAIGVFAPAESAPSNWREVVLLARGELLYLFLLAAFSLVTIFVMGSLVRARRLRE